MKNKLIILAGVLIIVSSMVGVYVLFNSNLGNQDKNNTPDGVTPNPAYEEKNKNISEKNNAGMTLTHGKEETNKNNETNISLNIYKNETYENTVKEKEKNTSMSLNTHKNETYENMVKESSTTEIREIPPSRRENITIYKDKPLEKNAALSFKVGKEYTYNVTEVNSMDIMKYVVEKMEMVDGRDCYAVSEYLRSIISEENKKLLEDHLFGEEIKEMETMTFRETNYYDKENGEIMQRILRIGPSYRPSYMPPYNVLIPRDQINIDISPVAIFSDWMLALKDNLTWEEKSIVDDDQVTVTWSLTYKVKGREKVNGRECFEVERTINATTFRKTFGDIQEGGPSQKATIWVDVNERITVKVIPDSDKDNPKFMLQLINEQ